MCIAILAELDGRQPIGRTKVAVNQCGCNGTDALRVETASRTFCILWYRCCSCGGVL